MFLSFVTLWLTFSLVVIFALLDLQSLAVMVKNFHLPPQIIRFSEKANFSQQFELQSSFFQFANCEMLKKYEFCHPTLVEMRYSALLSWFEWENEEEKNDKNNSIIKLKPHKICFEFNGLERERKFSDGGISRF